MNSTRNPWRRGASLTALAAAILAALPATSTMAQAQPGGGAAEAATPAGMAATRRLSSNSTGAINYVARIRQALTDLAQEHPEVQSARAAATTSEFDVETAKRARYPRLKVGTATGNYNSGATNARSQNYTLLTAEVRVAVIDGGAMSARVKAAELQTSASTEAVRSTSQKVVLDAITAYLQVQRYDLKKQIAHKSTQVVDELSRVEQRRVALGAAGESNLRLAASRRAAIGAKESDFEAQRGDAVAKFRSYFKFTPNTTFLPVLAAPPEWQIGNEDAALRLAEDNSAEIGQARARVERAKALVDQQEASRFPTLEAVVGKSHDPRGLASSEPTRAAVEIVWNFGNGFDQSARIKAAIVEVDNQEAQLETAKLNLFEQTSASWNRTLTGRERERQLLEAVSESGESFRGRRRLMEFGRETLPAVLDAQLDYYTLLLDYVDAVYDLRISEFRLARTVGRLWVAPDTENAWVDHILTSASRPVLSEEALLGMPCLAAGTPCKGRAEPLAPQGAPGTGLPLRMAPRIKER